MEQLQARIHVQHIKGAEITYLYNRESFDLLKIKRHKFDNSQFIEIGQILEIDGKKYEVKNINFKMEEKMNIMDNKYGINLYSPTDPSDFNCQIGVFVDNAE